MKIAQGQRGTSATLGSIAPKLLPSPREARAGRGIKGEGPSTKSPHMPLKFQIHCTRRRPTPRPPTNRVKS
jgi:hypothetical protein